MAAEQGAEADEVRDDACVRGPRSLAPEVRTEMRVRMGQWWMAGALLGSTVGCMGVFDIFNRSTRELPSGYCLELDREFAHYRVQDCSGRRDVVEGVGVVEGMVESIGWNEQAIVAWRSSCCGDGDGFVIIDVVTDKIEGPVSQEELEGRLKSDGRLKGIRIQPVSEVLK
jgi:hypothetical protein